MSIFEFDGKFKIYPALSVKIARLLYKRNLCRNLNLKNLPAVFLCITMSLFADFKPEYALWRDGPVPGALYEFPNMHRKSTSVPRTLTR